MPKRDTQFVRKKRLTVDIPQPLHTQFKMLCAGRETQMTDVVRQLIEQEVMKELQERKRHG